MRQISFKSTKNSATKNKWAFVLGEACLLAGLVYFNLPTIQRVSDQQAQVIARDTIVHDIKFLPYLECKSAVAKPDVHGISVTVLWQALKSGALDCFATVQTVDKFGNVLNCMTYSLDPRCQYVRAGTIWRDSFLIPSEQVRNTSKVVIYLSKSQKKPLFASGYNCNNKQGLEIPIAPCS